MKIYLVVMKELFVSGLGWMTITSTVVMVIVCMAMIDDRRQRMMMFRGWKLYCGDFVGGRLTLTLKYQFSLVLESAGQKIIFMFSCFLFILI